jgi:poly-gamma-glutamate capsule biosynthesis protein CapA/YwtB (metallophosphatase superfamily)
MVCTVGAGVAFLSKPAPAISVEKAEEKAIADTLTLLFAGDIMCHTSQFEAAQTGKNSYDFSRSFQHITPIISSYDLAIGNLETSLPRVPPYYGHPMFKSPDALPAALKDAGFDILVTANNHCADSKLQGVLGTINCLDSLQLGHTGTFKHAKERALNYPYMLYRKGMKLALLNYTYGINGMAIPKPTVINLIDTALMKKDLAVARAAQADFIIAFMHWGPEDQTTESKEQRALAQFLIQHGADLVIGAHPHVVQPVRKETVGNTSAWVIYSLGNFISSQNKLENSGGMLYTVTLTKTEPGQRAEMADHSFIPIWRHVANKDSLKPKHMVVADNATAETLLSESEYQMMQTWLTKVRQRLVNVPEVLVK